MPTPRFRLEIFLLALAVILLEINFTRVFSFKLVYYFTYLVIGLAMLGLGSGGIALSLSSRLRRISPERLIAGCSLVAATSILLGYLVVARTPLHAFDMIAAMVARPHANVGVATWEVTKLLVVALVLFVPFFATGLGITTILATQPAHAGRLYFADLTGAALGCAAAVPLMRTISPPGAIMLGGAVLAVAAWRGLPRARVVSILVGAVLIVAALVPSLLPEPVVETNKTLAQKDPPHDIVFSAWSPVFRVDVLKPTPDFSQGEDWHLLAHDGQWGSVIHAWDGDDASLQRYAATDRRIPFDLLGMAHPRVVIIGSAGGNEIFASLAHGARHVTGIELNPVTVSLLRGEFADYTAHVAEDPRVELVNGEGRSTLARDARPADLVWFVAPDSYAAMNAATAGAFVLSESYLYTVEMVTLALRHLTPGGILCFQFGEEDFEGRPNRTIRFVTTARAALASLGVTDPGRHMVVSTAIGFGFQSSTILLRATPFTDEEVDRVRRGLSQLDGARLRWPTSGIDRLHPVARVIGATDEVLDGWLGTQPYNLAPVRDDAPFFWHFVPFGRALRGALGDERVELPELEHGLGEILLATFLAIATFLAALLLLLPLYLNRRRWRSIPHKVAAGTYFAALGLGFMFFEVPLIQHLTLFLGYPTYSLTVTLCGLLVSAGIGALASERVERPRQWLPVALGVLALLTVFYRFGLPPLMTATLGGPLAARIAIALTVLLPLGLCLGTFMPLGLRTVAELASGDGQEELVAWAWAVNGFFSVVASVLATVLAMTYGFQAVMLLALGIYVLGAIALTVIARPASG